MGDPVSVGRRLSYELVKWTHQSNHGCVELGNTHIHVYIGKKLSPLKKLKGYRGGVYGIHTSSASEKKIANWLKSGIKKKRNGAFCAVQVWGKISCMWL